MVSGRLRVRVAGRERWLDVDDVAIIGRDEECDIRVPSGGISRRHARLRRGPRGWILEDLGSTNGTWLRGDRVASVVVDQRLSVELGPGGMPVTMELEPVSDGPDRERSSGRWCRRARGWFMHR